MASERRPIDSVLRDHLPEWMAVPGVVGAGVGEYEGRPCIKLLLSRRVEELRPMIPSPVEGYEVLLEETGEFRALET